jgi:hypothetical protein
MFLLVAALLSQKDGHLCPAVSSQRQLRPVHSIPGAHNEMIFALAVDAAHQQFVTGAAAAQLHSPQLPAHNLAVQPATQRRSLRRS